MRRLTLVDRDPEQWDCLSVFGDRDTPLRIVCQTPPDHKGRFDAVIEGIPCELNLSELGSNVLLSDWEYIARADGGPVTVEE